MPDISPILLAITGGSLLLGALIGWFVRGRRLKLEMDAIHASWQEHVSMQRIEYDRLAALNKNLMEQVSRHRSAQRDSDQRARKLTESLAKSDGESEALRARLDEAESRLKASAAERKRLKDDMDQRIERELSKDKALQDKDQEISRLGAELSSWKSRLPPLVERFRERNLEAEQLEVELAAARAKAADLEQRPEVPGSSALSPKIGDSAMCETRVETIEDDELATDLDASNEQFADESAPAVQGSATTLDTTRHGATSIKPFFKGKTVGFDRNTADDAGLADDLKRIKGVGPAMEKVLVSHGITRFEQIAGMSELDVDRVARTLPGFKSRIYREDWMGQARALQRKQPGS